MSKEVIPMERIAQVIVFGALTQAVKRNANRFPADIVFQLTPEEVANLKSQMVISSLGGARSKLRPSHRGLFSTSK